MCIHYKYDCTTSAVAILIGLSYAPAWNGSRKMRRSLSFSLLTGERNAEVLHETDYSVHSCAGNTLRRDDTAFSSFHCRWRFGFGQRVFASIFVVWRLQCVPFPTARRRLVCPGTTVMANQAPSFGYVFCVVRFELANGLFAVTAVFFLLS